LNRQNTKVRIQLLLSRSDPAGLATASDSVGLAEKTPTMGFPLIRFFDETLEADTAFSVIVVCIYTLRVKKICLV
jgi:hypothetical protein